MAFVLIVATPGHAVAAAPAPEIVVTAPTPLIEDDRAAQSHHADIAASHALDLTDYIDRRLGSVYINAIQGNPLQPDVNYRGYTASPLLGTPQGLSVYLDGVRQNQPFGDVVNWDLIPREAIGSISLVSGSNPLFGRNTLGGALAMRTRNGRDDPGTQVEANYGSFRRRRVAAETGGSAGAFDWFVTANHFAEHGWRDASPSAANQVFARLGWREGATRLSLTGSFADTNLTGNGLQEMRLLAADRDSVYTRPDETRNRAYALTLTGRRDLSDTLALSANAYYRRIRTRTFNGDINDDALGANPYQPTAIERAALAAAGYADTPASGETQGNTPFPRFRCIADALLDTEPNETCDGLANRTMTRQHYYGTSGELVWTGPLLGHDNRLVLGGNWEADRAHFRQSSQFAYLNPDRGVVAVSGAGAFADGTQDSEDAFDARVDLAGRTDALGLFATDTWSPVRRLALTLSTRYDRTVVHNRDRLTPGGGPGSLDGTYRYDRVNPAATLDYTDASFGAHVTLSQGSRAPSAIELGCADPDTPCRLPNALAGDPPLRQVVTRTIDLGARGRLIGGAVGWSLSLFRAGNRRDILFVSDDVSGYGYFRNFGRTRRQGIELGLDARRGPFSLEAHYTYLDATYRSAETVDGSANSSNDGPSPGLEGSIAIARGDRIPLIPHHILRATLTWTVTPRISVTTDVKAQSGMIARGNENGEHVADGEYYLGPGRSGGFTTMDFNADWRPATRFSIYAQLSNVFDRHYATAAQLSATGFDGSGRFVARPFAGPVIDGERPLVSSTFYAPGAPRMVWLGIRMKLGRDAPPAA